MEPTGIATVKDKVKKALFIGDLGHNAEGLFVTPALVPSLCNFKTAWIVAEIFPINDLGRARVTLPIDLSDYLIILRLLLLRLSVGNAIASVFGHNSIELQIAPANGVIEDDGIDMSNESVDIFTFEAKVNRLLQCVGIAASNGLHRIEA